MTMPNNCSGRPTGSVPGFMLVALAVAALPKLAAGQETSAPEAAAGPAVTRGIYNWVHTTGNAELSFAFYQDVFRIELEHSTFAGPASANAPPPRIRSVDEAGSDTLVWNLTNTEGARFRTAFMHAANTPFGLELSEFFDIPRSERFANPWDPGASKLIFSVRNLDAIVAALEARDTPVVTLGGEPLDTPVGRSILVRDPDGYLVEVIQGSRTDIANAEAPGTVLRTSIGISVADTATSLAFYRDLLGFDVIQTRHATNAELRLNGLSAGQLEQTNAVIPGTDVIVRVSQFASLPAAAQANPFSWKIQDVGAPQFQLQVAGLDALLERTHQAGYRFLSVRAQPIQRPFGRFVFAIDPDGVLVEYVEPRLPAEDQE